MTLQEAQRGWTKGALAATAKTFRFPGVSQTPSFLWRWTTYNMSFLVEMRWGCSCMYQLS